MDITEFMFGSNSNVAVLQIIIIILALVIIGLLFSETHDITDKIDKFKCPACPACNCDHKNECPDCICEKGETGVECPTCPTCPEAPECPKLPDKGTGTIVKDILDGIFPGKNRGKTKDGKYFPLSGLGETTMQAAYSPVADTPNYLGGGLPAKVSFEDSKDKATKIASEKAPAMGSGQGVFTPPASPTPTQPSPQAAPGGEETIPEEGAGAGAGAAAGAAAGAGAGAAAGAGAGAAGA